MESDYYYLIRLVSDVPLSCNGTRCCTSVRDLNFILELYPHSRVEKYRNITPQSELRELFS